LSVRAVRSPILVLEGHEAGNSPSIGGVGLVTKSTLVPVVDAPVVPVVEGALVVGMVGQDGVALTTIGLAAVLSPCVGTVMGSTATTTDVLFHTS
jgi:hypothetical protein